MTFPMLNFQTFILILEMYNSDCEWSLHPSTSPCNHRQAEAGVHSRGPFNIYEQLQHQCINYTVNCKLCVL